MGKARGKKIQLKAVEGQEVNPNLENSVDPFVDDFLLKDGVAGAADQVKDGADDIFHLFSGNNNTRTLSEGVLRSLLASHSAALGSNPSIPKKLSVEILKLLR